MRIFGVILAGGQARRMGGRDKAFLPLAGKPLIMLVLERFQPQVERVLISANGDALRFQALGCDVVPDDVSQGPLSGVLSALTHAAGLGASHLVSTPVDTPFLPPDLVPRLLLAGETSDRGVAIARAPDGNHPITAVWPVALAADLAAFLLSGETKVTRFTDACRAGHADFPDPRAFLNLNRPDDLLSAEALLGGAT